MFYYVFSNLNNIYIVFMYKYLYIHTHVYVKKIEKSKYLECPYIIYIKFLHS